MTTIAKLVGAMVSILNENGEWVDIGVVGSGPVQSLESQASTISVAFSGCNTLGLTAGLDLKALTRQPIAYAAPKLRNDRHYLKRKKGRA